MRFLSLLLFAAALGAQTTNYPGALDTNSSLFVTADSTQSQLTVAMQIADVTATVSSSTGFVANMIVTICDTITSTGKCTVYEHMLVTGVAGNVLTVTRGFAGTAARTHANGKLITSLIDSAHQKVLKDAVIQIETLLGVNGANIPALSLPLYPSATYNYSKTVGSGVTGDLSVAGSNLLTFATCPLGLAPNEKAISSITAFASGALTGAANATPIVVTEAGHGRSSADIVVIGGVTGNLAANGRWAITVINANSYSLDSSSGSGAYSAGGTVYREPLLTLGSALAGTSSVFVTIAGTTAGGGGPSLNGVWPITYVDSTHARLLGAPATGSYSGGYLSYANYQWAYISAGTGTAEAVAIAGGSCTSGATNGTLRFTTANTHTGNWAIGSASSGIRETESACPTSGCNILLASGALTLRAPLYIGDGDIYSGLGFSRSVDSTYQHINLIGQGSGTSSGIGEDAGTELRFIGTDGTSAAVHIRAFGVGLDRLKINTCRFAGSCAATGLYIVGAYYGGYRSLLIQSGRAAGIGIRMSQASENVFQNVDVFAQNTGGVGLYLAGDGFNGQYGSGGASANTFMRMDLWPASSDATAVGAAIGAADNNSFYGVRFMGDPAAVNAKGILFVAQTSGTTQFFASFPQENSFFHSPVLGGISGNAGSGTCNEFLPYPLGDGEPTPTNIGVCGKTTNGKWFGASKNYTFTDGSAVDLAKFDTANSRVTFGVPIATKVGADVASASTIAPTGQSFRLTGTTTVNTISLPWTGYEGTLQIIPTGLATFGTSGNIVAAMAAVPNVPITATYIAAVSKWYLTPPGPYLIASTAATAQTASIATANFIAVPPAGMYEVCLYLTVTTAGTGGTVLGTIGWTDSGGAKTLASSTAALTGSNSTQVCQRFESTASAITYATTVAGATGTPAYAIHGFVTRYR